MHEELKSAGGSARLASQVASCIAKALQLLAEKAEYMAATGGLSPSAFQFPPRGTHVALSSQQLGEES